MLNVKVKTIVEAVPVIAQIAREKRPMPQAGKFRLARMHAVLLPIFSDIMKERDELIKSYNTPVMVPAPVGTEEDQPQEMIPSENFEVPADQMADYNEKWSAILAESEEVNINPIPISMLSPADAVNGSIETAEIATMDELVCEPGTESEN